MELPNAATGRPPKHVDADYYYSVPAAVIYRTYPVYLPGREPDGYIEDLLQREPEIVFDAAALRGDADWSRAGEHVFRWPTSLRESTDESRARFRDAAPRHHPRPQPCRRRQDAVVRHQVPPRPRHQRQEPLEQHLRPQHHVRRAVPPAPLQRVGHRAVRIGAAIGVGRRPVDD